MSNKKIAERARAVIIVDNKILLIHRIKKDESYWVIPGGGVELGENPEQAVKRECVEELGVTICAQKLFIKRISDYSKTMGHCEFFYLCDIVSGEVGTGQGPEFQPNTGYEGEHKISWISLEKLSNINLMPLEVKHKIIKEYLK
ncbi:MAG: NUDIX domain-containing protein [Patescibacteria group bacterium]|nr:NUDIX domain-containing protein [Patescibacteria group bacterium]